MEESNTPEKEQPGSSNSLLVLWRQFRTIVSRFLGKRFSIIDLADPEATIQGIKKGCGISRIQSLDFNVQHHHSLYWSERQFDCCCYWRHVNISINGSHHGYRIKSWHQRLQTTY